MITTTLSAPAILELPTATISQDDADGFLYQDSEGNVIARGRWMSAVQKAQFLRRQMLLASARSQLTTIENGQVRDACMGARPSNNGNGSLHAGTSYAHLANAELATGQAGFEALYELFATLSVQDCLESALNEVLLAAIALVGADAGFIRLFDLDEVDPNASRFPYVAHIGLPQAYLDYHSKLPQPTDPSARSNWFRGERVIVEDIATYPPFQLHHPELLVSAGYRSMQGSPLMSRNGSKCVGTIATCFRRSYTPSPEQFDVLDLYAEIAANVIEHHQQVAELARRDAVRESVLRRIYEQVTELEGHQQAQEVRQLAGLIARQIQNGESELGASGNGSGETEQALGAVSPYGLSDREMEVLLNVWRGFSDKQIARHLGISRFTVAKHVGAIIRKMNVGTRTQASVIVERDGLFKGV